jgi:hypothetical protein
MSIWIATVFQYDPVHPGEAAGLVDEAEPSVAPFVGCSGTGATVGTFQEGAASLAKDCHGYQGK